MRTSKTDKTFGNGYNLLLAAAGDLLRHPQRSAVTAFCLMAALVPMIVAFAISEGLRQEAEISVAAGADTYVSRDLLGAQGPIALTDVEKLAAIGGVVRAVPRVVGRTYFADRLVAVVGLDGASLEKLAPLVRGSVPRARGEVIVGGGIADEFGIKTGMPFILAANKNNVFKTVGILDPVGIWSHHLLAMHYEDADRFFGLAGFATHALLYLSHPSSFDKVAIEAASKSSAGPTPTGFSVMGRDPIEQILRSGYDRKGGIFTLVWLVAGILCFTVLLITMGSASRHTAAEIGIMKTLGWSSRDILEKVFFENLLIGFGAVSLAILISFAWLKGLNGVIIAQFYVAEIGVVPRVDVPSLFLPSHALCALALALACPAAGGLTVAWIAARKPPAQSVRL